MLDDLWLVWVDRWHSWEALARRRGWTVTPLKIEPPASAAEIARVEAANGGMSMPPQLRALLERSRCVQFGWVIPSHLQSMEWDDKPTASHGIRSLWDVGDMADNTGPGIVAMRGWIADEALSKEVDSPDSGVGQFGVWTLPNGDYLTIDTHNTIKDSAGCCHQPLRYVSHEFDMLHGCALSNDLFGFIDEMSKLGHAGTQWASWMGFGTEGQGAFHFPINANASGARAGLAWSNSDHDAPERAKPMRKAESAKTVRSTPPKVVVAKTDIEHAMLFDARAGRFDRVLAAIEEGAQIDACLDDEARQDAEIYSEEFWTPLTYAVRDGDGEVIERLMAQGATLDTRVTPVSVAVSDAGPEMLRGLLDAGARVERWAGERYTPLYDFVNKRSRTVAETRDTYETHLREQGGWNFLPLEQQEAIYAKEAARHLTSAQYFTMLEMLLAAGADPNATGDNGTTALFWAGPETARRLLKGGANPNTCDAFGSTPLHLARDAEKVRVLIDAGADPNILASGDAIACTPLQISLLGSSDTSLAIAQALIEGGADAGISSRDGRPTIHWCTSLVALDLALSWGLEPHERAIDGSTILHSLYKATNIRSSFREEISMLDRILGMGIDINAIDRMGQTLLHIASVGIDEPNDIALLLDRGANPNIRDIEGKRPFDLAPRSSKAVRALLRSASK